MDHVEKNPIKKPSKENVRGNGSSKEDNAEEDAVVHLLTLMCSNHASPTTASLEHCTNEATTNWGPSEVTEKEEEIASRDSINSNDEDLVNGCNSGTITILLSGECDAEATPLFIKLNRSLLDVTATEDEAEGDEQDTTKECTIDDDTTDYIVKNVKEYVKIINEKSRMVKDPFEVFLLKDDKNKKRGSEDEDNIVIHEVDDNGVPTVEGAPREELKPETEEGGEELKQATEEATGGEEFKQSAEEPAGEGELKQATEEVIGGEELKQAIEEGDGEEELKQETDEAAGGEKIKQATEQAAEGEKFKQATEEAAGGKELKQATEEAAGGKELKQATKEATLDERLKQAIEEASGREELKQSTQDGTLGEKLKQATEQAPGEKELKQVIEEAALGDKLKQATKEATLGERLKQKIEEACGREELKQSTQEGAGGKELKRAIEEADLGERLKKAIEEVAGGEAFKQATKLAAGGELFKQATEEVGEKLKQEEVAGGEELKRATKQATGGKELKQATEEAAGGKELKQATEEAAGGEVFNQATEQAAGGKEFKQATQAATLRENLNQAIEEAGAEAFKQAIEKAAYSEEQVQLKTSSESIIENVITYENPKNRLEGLELPLRRVPEICKKPMHLLKCEVESIIWQSVDSSCSMDSTCSSETQLKATTYKSPSVVTLTAASIQSTCNTAACNRDASVTSQDALQKTATNTSASQALEAQPAMAEQPSTQTLGTSSPDFSAVVQQDDQLAQTYAPPYHSKANAVIPLTRALSESRPPEYHTLHIDIDSEPSSSVMRRPPLLRRLWMVVQNFASVVCNCLLVNRDCIFFVGFFIGFFVTAVLLTAFLLFLFYMQFDWLFALKN